MPAPSRSRPRTLSFDSFNTTQGADETRPLLTGLHITADITCNGCSTVCGWKYVRWRVFLVPQTRA